MEDINVPGLVERVSLHQEANHWLDFWLDNLGHCPEGGVVIR